jgi:hypothetical protein
LPQLQFLHTQLPGQKQDSMTSPVSLGAAPTPCKVQAPCDLMGVLMNLGRQHCPQTILLPACRWADTLSLKPQPWPHLLHRKACTGVLLRMQILSWLLLLHPAHQQCDSFDQKHCVGNALHICAMAAATSMEPCPPHLPSTCLAQQL